jgi:hypothetical protein
MADGAARFTANGKKVVVSSQRPSLAVVKLVTR